VCEEKKNLFGCGKAKREIERAKGATQTQRLALSDGNESTVQGEKGRKGGWK